MHFKFVTLKPGYFFGYRRELWGELPVVVADEPKAILDSLSLPQYAGGVPEVAKALQNALADGTLELQILLEYAGRMNNASLRSRLGYLLELLGQSTAGLEPAKGPLKLDPHRPARGRFDRRWQLYVNVEPKDLFPRGVL